MGDGDGDGGSPQFPPVVPQETNIIFGKVGKKVIVKGKIELMMVKELINNKNRKLKISLSSTKNLHNRRSLTKESFIHCDKLRDLLRATCCM